MKEKKPMQICNKNIILNLLEAMNHGHKTTQTRTCWYC